MYLKLKIHHTSGVGSLIHHRTCSDCFGSHEIRPVKLVAMHGLRPLPPAAHAGPKFFRKLGEVDRGNGKSAIVNRPQCAYTSLAVATPKKIILKSEFSWGDASPVELSIDPD